jgi:hypothetical protein
MTCYGHISHLMRCLGHCFRADLTIGDSRWCPVFERAKDCCGFHRLSASSSARLIWKGATYALSGNALARSCRYATHTKTLEIDFPIFKVCEPSALCSQSLMQWLLAESYGATDILEAVPGRRQEANCGLEW